MGESRVALGVGMILSPDLGDTDTIHSSVYFVEIHMFCVHSCTYVIFLLIYFSFHQKLVKIPYFFISFLIYRHSHNGWYQCQE